mmetsp:Transcript_17148/g.37024  ORF Transcript_17148/g.37024 Transcript_17148/m.37024 type:complete len:408 (+) Transcript_17148:1758-2981(+)
MGPMLSGMPRPPRGPPPPRLSLAASSRSRAACWAYCCCASRCTSSIRLGPSAFWRGIHLRSLRSITSWIMKRMRLSRVWFSRRRCMRAKYASIFCLDSCLVLLSSWPPTVIISLHRHSTSSARGFCSSMSSCMIQLCMIFSVSRRALYSWPMNWMLPNIRLRALRSSSAFLASSCLAFCSASCTISPSSTSSPSFFASPFSVASSLGCFSAGAADSSLAGFSPLAAASADFFSRSATACMAAVPFSNSSWHLLSSRRLKSIFFSGFSGLSNEGSKGWMVRQRLAYISQNVVSTSALSKIWSIRPSRVFWCEIPTSMICLLSFSKLSMVSLLRMPLNVFCFFSSSGSMDTVLPAIQRLSVLCKLDTPPLPPRAIRPPGEGGGGGPLLFQLPLSSLGWEPRRPSRPSEP